MIGKALALKRRLENLADNQLFIALAASQTDVSSLQRSLPALGREAAALHVAATKLGGAVEAWRNLRVYPGVRDLQTKFLALMSVLR